MYSVNAEAVNKQGAEARNDHVGGGRCSGMQIEIWSDVVCPWCYIGKRRLESALAGFDHSDEVEVVYRSFQLDPSAPRDVVADAPKVADHLASKYGMSVAQARQMQQQVSDLAAAEGMSWDHGNSPYVNTVDAHRLLQLALAEYGAPTQLTLKEALLDAYFGKAQNVADHAILTRLATSAGLDPARVEQVLGSDEFEDAVAADQQQAAAFGANGVPFFVIDRKYGISGAQPVEVFEQALTRAYSDRKSVV